MPSNESESLRQAAAGEPDVDALDQDSPIESIPSEVEDAVSTSSHYEIVSIPADFTLEGLVTKWKKGQLTIPGYQRKFVWTLRQSSRLIESFLLGLPVPALFLYADPDTGEQQVIDGQQRLMSVVQFFSGEFRNAKMIKPRPFRLTGLGEDSPYAGLNIDDLEEGFPGKYAKLSDAVMRAFMIKQLDPDDATSVYHIFERLNTGGSVLLGQEIRNCVYHGRLNDLLISLNADENWREIIGKPQPDDRMRDVEMILRFVALYYFSDQYKKPMKDFLSWTMKKKRNLSVDEAKALEKTFRDTCARLIGALGTRPFHKDGGRMNAAVYDTIFTTTALHGGQLPEDFKDRCDALIFDSTFEENTSQSTTDAAVVSRRLALSRSRLFDAQ